LILQLPPQAEHADAETVDSDSSSSEEKSGKIMESPFDMLFK
jgi:hypothetical protein